ncbi:MAG: hypothetical protein K6U09_04950 [Acidobacteriia bacterium]|jgi:hypothetical protein|nr:hypothetical protein [Terriglobia bacterium]
MPRQSAPAKEFTVGTYLCPNTNQTVPLRASQPVQELSWPVVVERCPACGQRHEIDYGELQHPPVFGYE